MSGSTKKVYPRLIRPVFCDRHRGKDVLLVLTGKSMKTHWDRVREFGQNKVVIACNSIPFPAQYHMFTNRKKFCWHHKIVPKETMLLLGCYISPVVIAKKIGGRAYEWVYYRGRYPTAKRGSLSVENGIVDVSPCDVGSVMMGVAVAMGAAKIWIAGMDGFSVHAGGGEHFEEDGDETTMEIRLDRERCKWDILAKLKPTIITPTVYEEYYAGLADIV